jgi:hypothetical protein
MAGAVEGEGMRVCASCKESAEDFSGWHGFSDGSWLCRKCATPEVVDIFIRHCTTHHKQPQPAASAWRTDEPPRDGTKLLIVTRGGMLCIAWYNAQSGEWNAQVDMSERLETRHIIAWASINLYGGDDDNNA